MAGPTEAELRKTAMAEIKELRGEIAKYQSALSRLQTAGQKPGSAAAAAAVKQLQKWMLDMVESHIVITRVLVGIIDAQQAVREIRDMGQKHEGQMTLGDLGLGPLILPRIGPGGSIGPFGPDIGGIRPKWR